MKRIIVQYMDNAVGIGVSAYLNAYAYTEDKYHSDNQSFILDIFGRETAVKAISSAFMTHKTLNIIDGDVKMSITSPYEFKFKRFKSSFRLPDIGKIYREVVIVDGKELVYIPPNQDKYSLLFKAFDSATTVPLYEGWKKELIKKLFQDECLVKLHSKGLDGELYLFNNSYYSISFGFDGYAEEFLNEKYPQRREQEEQVA